MTMTAENLERADSRNIVAEIRGSSSPEEVKACPISSFLDHVFVRRQRAFLFKLFDVGEKR